MDREGIAAELINAGVSGDTASGGLERLDWSVPQDADAVVVELGANDALRGLDPAVTRKALSGILERLKARGQPVLLTGMLAPPNYGKDYAAQFDAIVSVQPHLHRTHSLSGLFEGKPALSLGAGQAIAAHMASKGLSPEVVVGPDEESEPLVGCPDI